MIWRERTGYGVVLFAIFFCAAACAQQSSQTVESIRIRKAARQHWQSRGRLIAGANAADLRRRAIAQKIKMRSAGAATAFGLGAAWNLLGPFPLPSDASGIGLQDYNWVSGRATAVAIDPNDGTGNTVYAGGAYGGLWKSTKAGNLSPNPNAVMWTALTDDQPTLAIGAIAVQPQTANPNPNKSVVLAGTGETNSSGDSYYGLGILRSADGGQSWTLISQDASGQHLFAGLGFSNIAFSTANTNVVVAGQVQLQRESLKGWKLP